MFPRLETACRILNNSCCQSACLLPKQTHLFLQANGKDLLESGVDMMQGVIAAVDGEKDPRCLMLSFQLAQQVVCVYEQASAKVTHAEDNQTIAFLRYA